MAATSTATPTTAEPAAYRGASEQAPPGVLGGICSADIEAAPSGEVVVFMIGMRINRLHKLRHWTWVLRQMPAMIRDLRRQPDSPLLGVRTWVSGRDIMTLQYWRSAEELGRFARDQDHPHARSWAEFNRRVAANADVGIWHETYSMTADNVETLYGNMPPHGLGAALGQVPAGVRRRTAAVEDRKSVG